MKGRLAELGAPLHSGPVATVPETEDWRRSCGIDLRSFEADVRSFEVDLQTAVAEHFGPRPRPALNALQRGRLDLGLSQGELAAKLGISRQTISKLENRRTTPSVALALDLAHALQTTVEELFGGAARR